MDHSTWDKIDAEGNIYCATYDAGVISSRTTIIRLSNHKFLVYSPGADLVKSALQIIEKDASVMLLAPCNTHIQGTMSWLETFPNATVIASDIVKKRILAKTTLVEVLGISYLSQQIPSSVSLHKLPNCRFGEVWVSIDSGAKVYWIVGDSIMNVEAGDNSIWDWLKFNIYRVGPSLEVTRIFRFFGISNKEVYQKWVIENFSNGRENALIPCHGEVYSDIDFTGKIISLTRKRFS